MAMAMDIQARLAEVRTRLENVRPNILPSLADKVRSGQGFGGNVSQRVTDILQARPIIGQAMRGTLITGGQPSPGSAALGIQQSSFRAVEGPAVVETYGNFRLAK